MAKTNKNILAVVGVACLVIGVTSSVPLFLTQNYLYGALSSLLSIIGIICLAVAFGD